MWTSLNASDVADYIFGLYCRQFHLFKFNIEKWIRSLRMILMIFMELPTYVVGYKTLFARSELRFSG